jgi:hypothetical protein
MVVEWVGGRRFAAVACRSTLRGSSTAWEKEYGIAEDIGAPSRGLALKLCWYGTRAGGYALGGEEGKG